MTKKIGGIMKNRLFKSFITTILLLGGGLAALTSFTSCDNFLNASQVKKEIEDAIAYNNAKEITVLIQSQVNTGSTLPSGNHIAKQGYEFEISFLEAQGYSFEKWIAVSKENPDQIVTDGVIFTDAASPKTKVKITNDKIPLQIIPQCTSRIAVSGEPSPQYNQNGVGWNRSIYVEFTKELSPASFIFAASELPQAAEPVYDSNNQIYAYTLEGQTYFKNLSITTADGLSVAQHFQAPAIDGKYLTIEADKLNRIPFATGETSKTIIVTLKNGISDITGVSMSAEKTWRYVIVDASDEKASINFTAGTGEGLLNAVSGSYSVGQTIDLLFTPNSDYQFIKWDYDSSILKIKDSANPDTTITVIEKTAGTQSSQVKAVCAPRPRIVENGFSPASGSTVPKNSTIQISFDHNLPLESNGYHSQLENISITIAGNPVKSSFLTPSITGGTVTFAADSSNMLEVPSGQTKTVTVTIPADFYYELEDEAHTKVYYGGNGKTWNYKINEKTNEETTITFVTNNTDSGTITKGPRSDNTYSLGERIDLAFDLDENFRFNGWKIYDANNKELTAGANGAAAVTIENSSALTTKLNVNAEVQGIKVVADTSMKLFVQEVSPNARINNKDSDITITLSKALDSICSTPEFLSQISVKLNGSSVDEFFDDRSVNGNKIIIKNTDYLNVTEKEQKTVSVSVPQDFYYKDRDLTVNLEQTFIFEYQVNSTTTKNVTVNYTTATANSGSINQNPTVTYNIGDTIDLKFNLAEGYQFTTWQIVDQKGTAVSNDKIRIDDASAINTKMHVLAYTDSIIQVTADAVLLPAVITRPSSTTELLANESLIMSFNMPLSIEDMKYGDGYVSLKYGSEQIANLFEEPLLSLDGKTLTLTPKGMQLYNYIKTRNTANISVKVLLGDKITVSKTINETQYILPLKQDGNSSFMVKYKNAVEDVPPQKYGFFATRQLITLENAANSLDSIKFTQDDFETFNETKVVQNLTGGTVYIYGRFYDADSGVNKITLTETHTNKKDGTEISQTPNIVTFTKNDTTWTNTTFDGTAQFSEEEKYTCFIITYNLKTDTSQDHNDGAFYFTVLVSDACNNNAQTESFTAIKDTILDISDIELYTDFSRGYTEANQKRVNVNRFSKKIFENYEAKVIDFCITYELNGNQENIKMTGITPSQYAATLETDTSNLVITLTANDSLENSSSKEFQFPPDPTVIELSGNKYQGIHLPAGIQNITGYEIVNNLGKKISERILDNGYEENYFYLSNSPKPSNNYVYYNGKLASKIVSYSGYPWYEGFTYLNTLSALSVESVEFGKMDGDYVDYTITVSENDFDMVFVLAEFDTPLNNGNKTIDMIYLPKGKRVSKSKVKLDQVYPHGSESKYYIWGVKNGARNYKDVSTITSGTPSKTYGALIEGGNAILYSNATPVINSYIIGKNIQNTYIPAFLEIFSDKSKMSDYFLRYVNDHTHERYPSSDYEKINLIINGIDHIYNNSVFHYTSDSNTFINDIIVTPVWDIENNREVIQLEATGKNEKTGVSLSNNGAFDKIAVKFNDITKQAEKWLIKSTEPVYGTEENAVTFDGLGLFVTKFNQDSGWQLSHDYSNSELSKNCISNSNRYYMYFTATYPAEENTSLLEDNSFLKIISYTADVTNPFTYSEPTIYYTGTPGTGNYDLLMSNGTSNSSVAIQSDAPVFVHTLTTKRPYEECKNWTAEKWEYMHRHIGEQQINFTSTDHSARRYSIPINEIDPGDYYVVIAHFSDNHIEMSQIMQK